MTDLTINVDEKLKKDAEAVFNRLGMDLPSAITLFLRTSVRCDGLPFEGRIEAFNDEPLAAIAEAEELKNHPEKFKHYDSVSDLMEDLNKDD